MSAGPALARATPGRRTSILCARSSPWTNEPDVGVARNELQRLFFATAADEHRDLARALDGLPQRASMTGSASPRSSSWLLAVLNG